MRGNGSRIVVKWR